jgi:hypothetical protein
MMMNEEQLQQDIRRVLKTFGVGAQREIEARVREALAAGTLSAGRPVRVRARLEVLGHEFVVEDELRLGEAQR